MPRCVTLVLFALAACARSGFDGAEGSTCKASNQCHSGAICDGDHTCRTVCSADSDCQTSVLCTAGVCAGGASSAPVILSVDGSGTGDGRSEYAAHRMRDRIVVTGSHLYGATIRLVASDGTATTLSPCAPVSDTRAELSLPTSLSAGSYVLTALNQAGTCNSSLNILQGESGALIDTTTICDGEHTGLMRYNATALGMEFCDGSLWQRLTSSTTASGPGATQPIGPPVSANVYPFVNATANYAPAFGAITNTYDQTWVGTGVQAFRNVSCAQAPTAANDAIVYDLGAVLSIGNVYLAAGKLQQAGFQASLAFSVDNATYADGLVLSGNPSSVTIDYTVTALTHPVSARYVRVMNAYSNVQDPDNATVCDIAVGPPLGTQTQPGLFVLSAGTYNGNLGGFDGANELCRSDLSSHAWLNKPAALNTSKVFAFLCNDAGLCTNLLPQTTYLYANAGDAAAGGASLTTDAHSTAPFDAVPWSNADRFNKTANYWLGARSGTNDHFYPNGYTACSCTNWSDSAAPSCTFLTGASSAGDGLRWGTPASGACNTPAHLICYVNP